MASSPPQSPPAATVAAKPLPPLPPAPTTITSLTDDILREIFLRLPSLPSLVRAALACRTFLHAVRSSTAFRRRFEESHPPPLIGLFFDPDGPVIPTFAPLRRRSDPDHVAAVRGSDFFLTRLPDGDDASPGWVMRDSRDGFLLLLNGITGEFVTYNPLTRALNLIPQTPDEIFNGSHGDAAASVDSFILSAEQDGGPLRVIDICHDESRVRPAIFSTDTKEWEIFPWSVVMNPDYGDKYWLKSGTMVNGIIYWTPKHTRDFYMLVLDTTTLQFSLMDLPPCFEGQSYLFRVGETKDRELCIVCPMDLSLSLWCRRSEKWMMDKECPLADLVAITEGSLEEHGELDVLGIVDGFVYFSTGGTFDDPHIPCWFLSLCLETAELSKLFQKKFDSHVRPYFMAWPPSLVSNRVRPQVEGVCRDKSGKPRSAQVGGVKLFF